MLVIMPSTADCCRVMYRVLRSIEVSQRVSFHTYSLLEDRLIRLYAKPCLNRTSRSLGSQFSQCCSSTRIAAIPTLLRTGF